MEAWRSLFPIFLCTSQGCGPVQNAKYWDTLLLHPKEVYPSVARSSVEQGRMGKVVAIANPIVPWHRNQSCSCYPFKVLSIPQIIAIINSAPHQRPRPQMSLQLFIHHNVFTAYSKPPIPMDCRHLLGALQRVRFQGGAQRPQDPLKTENTKRKNYIDVILI